MSIKNNQEYSSQWWSIYKHGKDMQLSQNFKLSEFQSGDEQDIVLVHKDLLIGLEKIRSHFGNKSIKINSGYRSREHNESIGGKKDSRHCLGLAADIVVDDVSPDGVASVAEALDFGGVGWYNTFTHIDVSGSNRRWDERS